MSSSNPPFVGRIPSLQDARAVAAALPAGWPPDVAPNQVIFASHINNIRSSVALWPGDVDGQNHWLRNVNLENVTGVMTDPTTAPGDLVVRGAAGVASLAVGGNGQVLTADTSLPGKLKWATPVGAVASVFGRLGAVVATAGDYTAAQVLNAVSDAGAYANPGWITALAWGKITGAPATFPPAPHTHDAADVISGRLATARLGTGVADATVYLRGDGSWAAAGGGSGGGVSTVFGRAGAVLAQAGDYSAAQVTGAVEDKTSVKGDLLVRTGTAIERLAAGADGQALVADATQAAGLKWATVTGTWIDPTTARGDMLVRNSVTIVRLPVGADGQVLTASSADALGIKWAPPSGSGGGAVASVFGRTGAVVATAGDYTAAMVPNAVSDLNAYGNPAWITSLAWGKIAGAPAFLTDPSTTKGDLLARSASAIGRLPVGSDGQVLVADAASTLGVKWSAAAGGGSQTPWLSNIDAANFGLNNVGSVGIGGVPVSAKLQIFGGTAAQQFRLGDGTNDYTIGRDSSSGLLYFNGLQSGASGYSWRVNNGTEAFRIDTNACAGLGAAPGNVLSGVGAQPRLILSQADTATASGSSKGPLVLVNPDQTGNNLTSILFATVGSNGTTYGSAQIAAQFTAFRTAGYCPTDLLFLTASAGGPIERMRITSTGRVGVSTSTPNCTLDVNGVLALRQGPTFAPVAGPQKLGPFGTTHVALTGNPGNFSVTGITPTIAGLDGQILCLLNWTSNTMTIKHQDPSVSGSERIQCPNLGADFVIAPYSGVMLVYFAQLAWWIILANTRA